MRLERSASNTPMKLTNTPWRLRRPSVLAAYWHVRWAEAASTSIGINFKEHLSVKCSG